MASEVFENGQHIRSAVEDWPTYYEGSYGFAYGLRPYSSS